MTNLYLSCNQIGAQGAQYLANALENNNVSRLFTVHFYIFFQPDAHKVISSIEQN